MPGGAPGVDVVVDKAPPRGLSGDVVRWRDGGESRARRGFGEFLA
ncbi:hypothetical protein [Myceligenerans cantabricum]